jgi:ornithine cyclodeaminase/alanine dehydrogenase-like protein (mu-crystallin family)
MSVEFRYLTQEEVALAGGLDMALVLDTVEEVFALFGKGECILPSKVVLRWGDMESERTSRGHINAMPGYVGGEYDMAGQKWAAGFYSNPADYGLPSVTCLVILNDPYRGVPVAVMDGTLISAMRTGAQAGVAAKYLARKDSQTVGLIGAGVQSRTLLMAFKTALPGLSHVLVYDLSAARSQSFCDEMRGRLDMSFEIAGSSREVASRADILSTATTAVSPIVKQGWGVEGSLYCQMGALEVEPLAIREYDKIIVDNWHEIQHREVPALAVAKTQGVISDEDIDAELSEVVLGTKPGRESAAERIFFSAVGMGLLDIAVGTRLLRQAEEQGIGTMLKLWEQPAFV